MFLILKAIDEQLFLFLNRYHTAWLDHIAYSLSHRLIWIPLYIGLIFLLAKAFQSKIWISLLMITLCILFCDQCSATGIKPWVQRFRPCEAIQLSGQVCVVGSYTGIYGFISSHAANGFGLAMLLWLLLRKKYPHIHWMFAWAMSMSLARVYGGVHYPGDIIVGALTGMIVAWLIYHFAVYFNLIPKD